MKVKKLFLLTLLTGLTVVLFSCRREEPEPSGNRDEVPCDTCDTVTPCSVDGDLIANKWWIPKLNDGTFNSGMGFYFKKKLVTVPLGSYYVLEYLEGNTGDTIQTTQYSQIWPESFCDTITVSEPNEGISIDIRFVGVTDSTVTFYTNNENSPETWHWYH